MDLKTEIMLLSLDEICLIPAAVSQVKTRESVNVCYENNKLPIFSAPMSCLLDESNYKIIQDCGINTIIPRTVEFNRRYKLLKKGEWVAFGYKEAEYIYSNNDPSIMNITIRICIDQAQGHLADLLDLCKKFKAKFGDNIILMTGNIANPDAYVEYATAGIDYVRIGIGGGNACTTSVQTGMHYPMGSLIIECNKRREILKEAGYKNLPKIVADGGFNKIDRIVKALGLGADYVMIGEIIAKSKEACSNITYIDYEMYCEYYGMSTKRAQKLINNASLYKKENFEPKHSEGISKWVKVEYSLNKWTDDFIHALRSSMSYANISNIKDFIGRVKYDTMSPVSYKSYMK